MRVAILTLAVLWCVPGFVKAHVVGTSYEQQVGEYTVDVGYDPGAALPGGRMLFDFKLRDTATGVEAPFDDVWFRVEQDKQTVLATGVMQPLLGPTTVVLMAPPLGGDLLVNVRYEKGGEPLAEASFPIPYDPVAKSASLFNPLSLGLGAIAGALLALGGTFAVKRFLSQA